MDPTSILGIITASFQFAEIALKTVSKLVQISQALEDAPKRMRDQLHDIKKSINRLRNFSTEMERDLITSSISPDRLVSLKLAVEDWVATAGDLESRLSHLLNPPTMSNRPKWKDFKIACKSLSQFDDVQWKIQRLESLSHRVWEELLRTLLESQLQVQTRIIDGEAKISSCIQEAFRKLCDERTDCEHRLSTTLREEGAVTQAAIGDLTTSVNASFNQLNLRASRSYVHMANKINDHVSEEFRLMRTFISSTRLGNDLALMNEQQLQQSLLGPVHNDLLRNSQDDIGSRETSWVKENTSVVSHEMSLQAHTESNRFPPACCCPNRSGRTWRVSKNLRLRYCVVAHAASCPLAPTTQQLRALSIHIGLPRFLGPTIELSLTTSTQRSGYTVAQSLRYFPTVKRLNSPIFAEFDMISAFLNKSAYTLWQQNDVDAFRSVMRNLPKKLQSIAASGAGSCRDKDEVGNTVLLVRAIRESGV